MIEDPHAITCQADLWSIVGEPVERVLIKETPAFNERSIAFVASSPFLLLATSAADGTCDVSPKGARLASHECSTSDGS
jgi:hypothetical protein